MSALRVEGGCLCGAVRYRAGGRVADATLCHCRTCRKAAGSPVVGWATFPAADFAFVAGRPVEFRSSPEVVRTFCGACGTPLTYTHADLPASIDVTLGSLDDPEALPPADHIWASHRLAWMETAAALPAHAATRPAGVR